MSLLIFVKYVDSFYSLLTAIKLTVSVKLAQCKKISYNRVALNGGVVMTKLLRKACR